MNEFSKINLYGETLAVKDEFARQEIEDIKNSGISGSTISSNANMQKNEFLKNNGTVFFKFNKSPDEKNIPINTDIENTLFSDASIKLQNNLTAKYNVNLKVHKNDIMCLFLYTTIESAKNINYMAVKLNNLEKFQFLLSEYVYKNGWNCLKFKVDSDTTITSIQIDLQVKTSDPIVYLDSIIVNYLQKSKVVLSFDNCDDDNLYGHIFPILKSYNFPASFSFQNGVIPDAENCLTSEHFIDLMKNGWDYSVYSNTQTEDYLKNYLAQLETKGVFNPICYSNPGNISTTTKIALLKKLGFKMERVSNALTYDGFFDKNSFDFTCFDPKLTGTTKSKEIIDNCIANGSCICAMFHKITESGSGNLELSDADANSFFLYLKNYVDKGLIEVITFSEYYGMFYPSDLLNTQKIIDYKRSVYGKQ